jgi:phosphate starvation-inducible protein PhoH and related proteins
MQPAKSRLPQRTVVMALPAAARYSRGPMSELNQRDFILDPEDNARLANLCGPFDEHLRQVELRLGVEINHRGSIFQVIGEDAPARATEQVLRALYATTEDEALTGARINLQLAESGIDAITDAAAEGAQEVVIKVKRGVIKGRGPNQARYLHAIASHDINFGVGPAGTGKTYLAVASAVEALEANRVQRLILVRPAVEAGEKLGFLPGDLSQKVDPYLRPLYDALYEMLGFEKVAKLIERNVIEIAPLAYMRGRTLNDSYVILDEAQNTTVEQMKMFLTRIGFGTVAVITGDVTQVDLPRNTRSGLRQAIEVLRGVSGINFTFFTSRDVVRHPLVAKIVRAYEAFEQKDEDVE